MEKRENGASFSFHNQQANFFRFMAADLSFTQLVMGQASVLGIMHGVFFLGVGKDPFNGFFPPLVQLLVFRSVVDIGRQPFIVLPDMPLYCFDTVFRVRTQMASRTACADR